MRTFEKNVLKNRDNASNISSMFYASSEAAIIIAVVVMKSIIFEILYSQYGASLQFSLPTHPFLSGTKTGRWKFLEVPIFGFCRHNPGSILMESDRSLTEGFQHDSVNSKSSGRS